MPAFRPVPEGTRYGRLVVVVDRERGTEQVRCLCDCGTEVFVAFRQLGTGTHSCGCLRREITRERTTTHGMTNTSIYGIWCGMIARCTRSTYRRFDDYGGRGITVCERWLDFENFYADMGDRPPGLSLDRTNNDLGYSPENCRWATPREQSLNQRPRRRSASCSKGHPFTTENTRIESSGARTCRICAAAKARALRASAKVLSAEVAS